MWKNYVSVQSVAEVVELLAEYGERARIIAGGTDLLIELERHQRPGVDVILDVSRVQGLNDITLHGDSMRLGPLVTHNDVVASPLIVNRALPLAQASWEVGAPQIRNRATIAGNLITASPANDTITPLLALNASVTLSSVQGERTLNLQDFYTGLRQTVMRPDEMLTAIHVPALAENERGMFIKLGLRRAQAISVVNAAVILAFDGETITHASISLGSVAPTVIRVPTAEQSLIGSTLTPAAIHEAARLASLTPTPIDDVRSTAEYRTAMIKVIVTRALHALAEHRETDGFPQHPAMLRSTGKKPSLTATVAHNGSQHIETLVNGKPYILNSGFDKTLLQLLREDLQLVGTKEGCAEGECGACTVFVDGEAVMACMVPAPRAHHAEIVTIEGLKTGDELHPIQQAFVDQAAVQCGYCTPGFIMSGAKLLEEYPNPTVEQIQQSISGNLCRCTGYYKIIKAFQQASQS